MRGMVAQVRKALESPLTIRVSKTDSNVLLYHRKYDAYYICVVIKQLDDDGFIITTYKTENIKEGEIIWPK